MSHKISCDRFTFRRFETPCVNNAYRSIVWKGPLYADYDIFHLFIHHGLMNKSFEMHDILCDMVISVRLKIIWFIKFYLRMYYTGRRYNFVFF